MNKRGGYRENAGRKSTWRHRKTCTVRIPEVFAETIVKLAHQLDENSSVDIETKSEDMPTDSVTKSIESLLASLKTGKPTGDESYFFDIETDSYKTQYDIVSNSDNTSLSGNTKEPDDIDTESLSSDKDFVSKSKEAPTDTVTNSYPSRNEAMELAKTILKAKKSARESVARLLSALYGTRTEAEELK